MKNFLFETIRVRRPKGNNFNLSHDRKMSMKMGQLVPIFCQQVLPGDIFKLNTELLIRFAPLVAPVMHRINVYTHYFFVPNRLLWDNWEDFITGGKDGKANPAYPVLRFNTNTANQWFTTGSLADYLGMPVMDKGVAGDNRFKGVIKPFSVDALPFKAYVKIWNDYYRDQNLQDEVDIQTEANGNITNTAMFASLCPLRGRAWTKDYFTAALPFAQRGEPVRLPLNGEASIYATESILGGVTGSSSVGTGLGVVGTGNAPTDGPLQSENGSLKVRGSDVSVNTGIEYPLGEFAKRMQVDLSTVSSSTIVELRNAFKAQAYLETLARSGSRYPEWLMGIFGVRSSDSRLQRPEYLGGGKQPVVVSDVMQTSQTTDTSALGTPGGAAASLGKTHSFKRRFEEHGYIIGIMSVLPEPVYQQGMPKQFMKFDRYDYYLPQFARIGEQEIDAREIYFDPSDSTLGTEDPVLFGYAPRYAEYKFINSSVHGDFRTSLKYWHLGRIFDGPPVLNGSFVTSNPSQRIFAVDEDGTGVNQVDKLWVNIHHNCVARRLMPKYGTPSI